jgi:all-trans-8'-apo-beta-carotenal 15,15'-oxygenase
MNPYLDAYNAITRRPRAEFADVKLSVERGELPAGLAGTLYRNGPGSMESFGVPYEHLFDGDGYIQRFVFDSGDLRYSARFVRTDEYVRELAAGRPLYRSFGTNLPGGFIANAGRFHFKNTANTGLLRAGDALLALWEGGAPYEVDPHSLETGRRWSNGGALAPRGPVEHSMGVGRPFSAHPKHVPQTGEILNFGMLPGMRQKMLLHRLPATPAGAVEIGTQPGSGEADRPAGVTRTLILPRLTFAHDFVALPDGRRIMFDVPVSFQLLGTFLGLTTPVSGIREDRSAPTIVRVIDDRAATVDRLGHVEQRTAETEPCYVFHFTNAYPTADSAMYVDACRMEHFPAAEDIRRLMAGGDPVHPFYAQLTRYTVEPHRGTVGESTISERPMELPTINPAYRGHEYRYVWSVADEIPARSRAALHGIAKFDVRTGESAFVDFYPNFAGEPFFVARPGSHEEDDGWLLVLAADIQRSRGYLHVFDAASMRELAAVRLPAPVHVGFHGLFEYS